MQVRATRQLVELILAAILGLVPLLFDWSNGYFAAVEPSPKPLARVSFALNRISFPGSFVGDLAVSSLGAYGVADLDWQHEHPSRGRRMGWRTASSIGDWTSIASNAALYAGAWFMWRSGGRRRRVALVLFALWLIVMVPLSVFASAWTVY